MLLFEEPPFVDELDGIVFSEGMVAVVQRVPVAALYRTLFSHPLIGLNSGNITGGTTVVFDELSFSGNDGEFDDELPPPPPPPPDRTGGMVDTSGLRTVMDIVVGVAVVLPALSVQRTKYAVVPSLRSVTVVV